MPLQTGKQQSDGQAFHRKLLSEYNARYTLSNYISYFELKATVAEMTAATTADQKQALESKFFSMLQSSFRVVKSFLRKMEKEAMEAVKASKRFTEDELRQKQKDYLPSVYHTVRSIADYRNLNALAFGKILRKFADRCAGDSLDLQNKVREADNIISHSEIAHPNFDANLVLNELCAMYGIVFRKSYEETMRVMDVYAMKDKQSQHRIRPMTDTYFFYRHFAHRESQGRFAMHVVAGRSNKFISKMVCEQLQCPQFPVKAETFANGEVSILLDEAVRGDDVFVIQSMVAAGKSSLSTMFMELALLIQTALVNSAARVSAVIPYIAYTKNTASIAALAEILVTMGCKHVITVDLYKEQVEGMFPNCPVDNVSAKFEFIKFLTQQLRDEEHDFTNICVVSPDSETVARAHSFADSFMKYAELTKSEQFVPICTAVKRVHAPETPASTVIVAAGDDGFPAAPPGMSNPKRAASGTIDVVGNVQDKLCIIIDYAIDEGVNVAKVAQRLNQKGASRIIAIATHAIFSADAVERLVHSHIDELIVSDSINQDAALKNPEMAKKLRIISIAPLLAQAMQRVHTENTLSTLFEK